MNATLAAIQQAADGLIFMSESDYPLEVVQLPAATDTIEEQLQVLTQKQGPLEQQSLEYFFRNAVKEYPEASATQKQTAQRFQHLKELLQTTLPDVQVYRLGEVQVDAFIVGRLPDGSYGGLRTKLIET